MNARWYWQKNARIFRLQDIIEYITGRHRWGEHPSTIRLLKGLFIIGILLSLWCGLMASLRRIVILMIAMISWLHFAHFALPHANRKPLLSVTLNISLPYRLWFSLATMLLLTQYAHYHFTSLSKSTAKISAPHLPKAALVMSASNKQSA